MNNMFLKYFKYIFFPFVILLLVFVAGYHYKQKLTEKSMAYSDKQLTVILTNFGRKNIVGQWTGETAPFMEQLKNKSDVSKNLPMCDSGYEGTIYYQPVLIITSGMAKVRTASCVTNTLQQYKGRVKEIILVGIAGFTPTKGGVIDNEPVMIGDVCINSAAFDFDLQYYTSDKVNSNEKEPIFWDQKSQFQAQFTQGNSALASELYEASLQVSWPHPSETVNEINQMYHRQSRLPKVWGPLQCIESTDDLFWHDINADSRAREMGAEYLSKTNNAEIKASDIIVASSMEAVSAGSVIDRWNTSYNQNVSFAYVRSASNFDHAKINDEGTPSLSGKENIENFINSGTSEYAIQTAAIPVMKLLELRTTN